MALSEKESRLVCRRRPANDDPLEPGRDPDGGPRDAGREGPDGGEGVSPSPENPSLVGVFGPLSIGDGPSDPPTLDAWDGDSGWPGSNIGVTWGEIERLGAAVIENIGEAFLLPRSPLELPGRLPYVGVGLRRYPFGVGLL